MDANEHHYLMSLLWIGLIYVHSRSLSKLPIWRGEASCLPLWWFKIDVGYDQCWWFLEWGIGTIRLSTWVYIPTYPLVLKNLKTTNFGISLQLSRKKSQRTAGALPVLLLWKLLILWGFWNVTRMGWWFFGWFRNVLKNWNRANSLKIQRAARHWLWLKS